jgi:hypothetical protein
MSAIGSGGLWIAGRQPALRFAGKLISAELLLHRTIKDDPDRKVLREILESMDGMSGGKAKVARTNRRPSISYPIVPGAGGYDVELITVVGLLWPIRRSWGKPHFQITVNECFG